MISIIKEFCENLNLRKAGSGLRKNKRMQVWHSFIKCIILEQKFFAVWVSLPVHLSHCSL